MIYLIKLAVSINICVPSCESLLINYLFVSVWISFSRLIDCYNWRSRQDPPASCSTGGQQISPCRFCWFTSGRKSSSFNDWRVRFRHNLIFSIGAAQSFRFAGTSRCTSGRGTRTLRIFGQLPSIPGWASIQAAASPVTIGVIIAKYSRYKPFAILPFSEATS